TKLERAPIVVDSQTFMKSVAAEVAREFGDLVTIEEKGPLGALDYQISFIPGSPRAAQIVWYTISDTFTISVSPRLEWRSEEWISFTGDEAVDRELSQHWSEDLIWRIINSGAQYIRSRSILPAFLSPSYVMVGDERFNRPHHVVESWDSWR
ncbi:hypothetical protein AAIH18_22550, partial [Pantoea agglomerans]|uniref:hypothetical protein n=1 Tax=Enterobacter agglomerans TaxID=549 RepID=UPI003D26F693